MSSSSRVTLTPRLVHESECPALSSGERLPLCGSALRQRGEVLSPRVLRAVPVSDPHPGSLFRLSTLRVCRLSGLGLQHVPPPALCASTSLPMAWALPHPCLHTFLPVDM